MEGGVPWLCDAEWQRSVVCSQGEGEAVWGNSYVTAWGSESLHSETQSHGSRSTEAKLGLLRWKLRKLIKIFVLSSSSCSQPHLSIIKPALYPYLSEEAQATDFSGLYNFGLLFFILERGINSLQVSLEGMCVLLLPAPLKRNLIIQQKGCHKNRLLTICCNFLEIYWQWDLKQNRMHTEKHRNRDLD